MCIYFWLILDSSGYFPSSIWGLDHSVSRPFNYASSIGRTIILQDSSKNYYIIILSYRFKACGGGGGGGVEVIMSMKLKGLEKHAQWAGLALV